MIDVIFAIKFIHVLAAGVMIGGWGGVALFMVLAHRSRNTAVVALTAQFVVRAEWTMLLPTIVVVPVSGFPLAYAIGISPLGETWLDISLPLYAVLLACWIAAFAVELRIRRIARQAALDAVVLPDAYRRLYRLWCTFAVPVLAGMIAIYALMIWQPRLD